MEEKFEKSDLVGMDGKPPSGKTWRSLIEDFRQILYDEHLAGKADRKKAKSISGSVSTSNSGDLDDSEDREAFEPFAVRNTVPNDWLPGIDHSWLLWVYCGQAGRNEWKTTTLPILSVMTSTQSDIQKTSRRVCKKLEPSRESVSANESSAIDSRLSYAVVFAQMAAGEEMRSIHRAQKEALALQISYLQADFNNNIAMASIHPDINKKLEYMQKNDELSVRKAVLEAGSETLERNHKIQCDQFNVASKENPIQFMPKLSNGGPSEAKMRSGTPSSLILSKVHPLPTLMNRRRVVKMRMKSMMEMKINSMMKMTTETFLPLRHKRFHHQYSNVAEL